MNTQRDNALSVLKKAKEILVENEWIKGSWAKDRSGKIVVPYSKNACQFCFAGAISRATYLLEIKSPTSFMGEEEKQNSLHDNVLDLIFESIEEIQLLSEDLNKRSDELLTPVDIITEFNDNSANTKQDVIDIIDRIIAKEKQGIQNG